MQVAKSKVLEYAEYATYDEAQAACERRYATGKWDY